MSVELILAPAATGKTAACIQRIQSLRQSEPLTPIWVLVPDAQNATYFHERLSRLGGEVGVHIGTFRALYTDILERQGQFTPVITPALEHRLVQQTVDTAVTAHELSHYAGISSKPGFINVLQDIFSELRSAFVSPAQFTEYTRHAGPAKTELAILYARFITQVEAIGWIDRDGQIWAAIYALKNDPQATTHIRLLIVDGFNAFAGARLEFLKQLSTQVGDLLITLPSLPDSTRSVHRRSQPVIETLLRELSPLVTELADTPHLPPENQFIEQHILDPGECPKFQIQKPIFLAAQSQGEEAREALRWIKALHLRNGVPLSACALFVSHLQTYRPYLLAAADEFGIRVYFSQPDPLFESPVMQSLLNLLELPLEDYKTRAVFNTLRSPYLDFGLTEKDIEDLALISQKARIVSGRDQWEEAWQMFSKISQEQIEALDDERQERHPLREIDFQALWFKFSKFWKVFDKIEEIRSQTEWVSWLELTLTDLQFFERLSGERDFEAIHALSETFRALELSEQVLGLQPTNYELFLLDLIGTVQGARLDEPREARQNAVFVSGIQHATATRFRAVALLGFSESLFPVVEHPDPFLDEVTRADLGLDPQLGREQASTFYQAFTRADQHLLVTRPYLAEHGESWDPSPYWIAATNLFTDDAIQKISPNTVRTQADAASPEELLFWAVQQQTLRYPHDEQLISGWQELRRSSHVLAARRSKQAHSLYEGNAEPIANTLAEKYGPGHTWSASRFETYATCPHQFYIQSVLALEPKEPPELGIDAAQLGNILHEILEKVYQAADSTTDLDALLAILKDYAASVFAVAPGKYGFRPSPLWQVEQEQFVEMLRNTIKALHAESQGWTPIGFEQKFGIQDAPALKLNLGAESVHLRGLIDRVDRNEQGMIRVIDYKTGGSYLSNADLVSGRRLQLPIYALAAQDALQLGTVTEGFYWQIRKAEASSFKLSKFKTDSLKGPQAAYAVAIEIIQQNLIGIRAGWFPPLPPKGGCPKYCPAVQWCWRYQAGY